MAGKGSRNRSANRNFWDADYWRKDDGKERQVQRGEAGEHCSGEGEEAGEEEEEKKGEA